MKIVTNKTVTRIIIYLSEFSRHTGKFCNITLSDILLTKYIKTMCYHILNT